MYIILIQNAALLLTLTVLYGLLAGKFKAGDVRQKIFAGLLFGLVAIAGMLIPLHYAPGIIYDGRSIIMSMAGLFGGGVVTVVSIVVAGGYRAYLGGNGIWGGLATIIACGLLGLAFRRFCGNRPERLSILQLYSFGLLVHIVMLACQLLVIPWPTGLTMISRLWLPVLLIFPLVTLLIGVSLGAEERRVQTERKLTASEALQRTLFQTIPDMIWLKDPNGVFLACNQMFERLMNATATDILGKTDYDLFAREQADLFREYDRKTMAAGKVSRNEEWVTFAADDSRALLETVTTPTFDSEGTFLGVLGIARDITWRKQAEEARRESEQKYRLLFENMTTGFAFHEMLYNEQGDAVDYRFLEINPAFEALTGSSAAALVGRTIKEIVPATEQYWIDTYAQVVRTGEPITFQHYAQALKKHFEVCAFRPVTGRFATVFSDITERKQAEEKLKKYHEQLEELVKERTATLEEKTVELEQAHLAMQSLLEDVNAAKQELEVKVTSTERLNRVFVDRELRMVELKKKIKELENKGASLNITPLDIGSET